MLSRRGRLGTIAAGFFARCFKQELFELADCDVKIESQQVAWLSLNGLIADGDLRVGCVDDRATQERSGPNDSFQFAHVRDHCSRTDSASASRNDLSSSVINRCAWKQGGQTLFDLSLPATDSGVSVLPARISRRKNPLQTNWNRHQDSAGYDSGNGRCGDLAAARR
jgi:hypothetical protein